MEYLRWFLKALVEVNLALLVGMYILHKMLLGFNYLLGYLIKKIKGEE
jgi:hypothetical protein